MARRERGISIGTALLSAFTLWLGLLAVIAGVAWAFTGDDVQVAPAREIRVTLTEFDIVPDTIKVVTGTHVVFVVDNLGESQHDLTIGDMTTGRIKPGESARLDAGVIRNTQPIWCGVKGHRPQGMEGTLEVSLVADDGDS